MDYRWYREGLEKHSEIAVKTLKESLETYNSSTMKKIILHALASALFVALIINGGHARAQRLKVMSYNIHIGQNAANEDRLREIGHLIKKSGADLVGLQEVDSVCNRSGNVDQMKVLSEITGMYYGYVRHFAFDGGSYGLGVLSKYPIEVHKNQRISISSQAQPETRALLRATVRFKGKLITFVNVHMDYRSAESRMKQSLELLDLFNKSGRPFILTGDLNASPDKAEIRLLTEVMTDCTPDISHTYPAEQPKSKIDYILVNSASLRKKIAPSILPYPYSDHLPAIVKLRLKFL